MDSHKLAQDMKKRWDNRDYAFGQSTLKDTWPKRQEYEKTIENLRKLNKKEGYYFHYTIFPKKI